MKKEQYLNNQVAKGDAGLHTSALYKLCTFGGVLDRHCDFVWRNWAPSRVRFFAWLLVQGRIRATPISCTRT
jgi:hypothetical protein